MPLNNIRSPMADVVYSEFPRLGLYPPCTPERLARKLEKLRSCTIEFRPHATLDPGVYGMVCKEPGSNHYCILFRPCDNQLVEARTKYHELGHIYLNHHLKPLGVYIGLLRGYTVADDEDAQAEQFAVAATLYGFGDMGTGIGDETLADEPESPLGHFLSDPFGRFLKRFLR